MYMYIYRHFTCTHIDTLPVYMYRHVLYMDMYLYFTCIHVSTCTLHVHVFTLYLYTCIDTLHAHISTLYLYTCIGMYFTCFMYTLHVHVYN